MRTLLSTIRTVYVHGGCPDGRASALLASDALNHQAIEFIELQHGDSTFGAIQPQPGVLFADLCPPGDDPEPFIRAGTLVLDHHQSRKDFIQAFERAGQGAYGDGALQSAAFLVYQHLWRPLREHAPAQQAAQAHAFAYRAAVRDTWQQQDPEWERASEQAEVLQLFRLQYLLSLGIEGTLRLAAQIGPDLRARKLEFVAHAARQATFLETALGRVAVMPRLHMGEAADLLASQARLVVGFAYSLGADGMPELRCSLRSRGEVDCAQIADAYGGGGHTQAAGFRASVQPDSPHPYAHIEQLFNAYTERTHSND